MFSITYKPSPPSSRLTVGTPLAFPPLACLLVIEPFELLQGHLLVRRRRVNVPKRGGNFGVPHKLLQCWEVDSRQR
jgi:hypothetical protein